MGCGHLSAAEINYLDTTNTQRYGVTAKFLCNAKTGSVLRNIAKSYCYGIPTLKDQFIVDLANQVKTNLLANQHVMVMGHSYGGSVAARVGELLNVSTGVPLDNLEVVTFGSIYIPPSKHLENIRHMHFMFTNDVSLSCAVSKTTAAKFKQSGIQDPAFEEVKSIFWDPVQRICWIHGGYYGRWKAHNSYTPLWELVLTNKTTFNILTQVQDLPLNIYSDSVVNVAAFGKTGQLMKLLTREPGVINHRDIHGFTPFMTAAHNLRIDMLEAMDIPEIRAVLDVNAVSTGGLNAAMLAIQSAYGNTSRHKDYKDVVRKLYYYGIDPNYVNPKNGNTVLHYFVQEYYRFGYRMFFVQFLSILTEANGNVTNVEWFQVKNHAGETILDMARRLNHQFLILAIERFIDAAATAAPVVEAIEAAANVTPAANNTEVAANEALIEISEYLMESNTEEVRPAEETSGI